MENTTSSPVENKDNIEVKINSQFNEEKWTRVGPKDVSISRFSLLDTILQQAKNEHFLDKLKELSIAHLEDYEQSVAARYFLGMIALKKNLPDETIYLKQLLDQFQEISKWAVVEYLADQMLQVSENRTILRAKATALEKLGKSKEVIPVLEKLAKIDRKNPDIAMKYADAIINEDVDKAVLFYKQAAEAYTKSLQFEKLKIVWNKLADLTPEDLPFFKKIERILSGHRQKEILSELYAQLTIHYIEKDDLDNIINLSKKVLEYNPNYLRFKKELVEAYKKKYKDHSLLEDFVRYSNLLNNKKNILNAIQDFETNIVFDKGNYVFHRSWGVGKIKELNTSEMIIDFKDKEAHRMDIQMALKSLKPLTEDHFWVVQFEKPKELENMFKTDILSFFKLMLSSFGNKVSVNDIKVELMDKYVPTKDWSKWWTKTRNQLLKDNLINISPQKKDIIELYETPVTPSDQFIEKFQVAQGFDERAAVFIATMKNPDEAMDALEYMQPFFKESLRSFDYIVRISSIFILDLMQEVMGDDEHYYAPEILRDIVSDLKKMNVVEAAMVGDKLKYTDLKKSFSSLVKANHPDWQKIFVELLLQTPVKIHKLLFSDLVEFGNPANIQEFFNRIRKDARGNVEVFLWAMKNLLTGGIHVENLPMEEQLLSFFRVLKLIPKLEPKGTKLKNAAKEIFLGATHEDLIKNITLYAKGSIRKFISLSKDITFFSDYEKEQVYQYLKAINPELVDEDVDSKQSVHTAFDAIIKSGGTFASQDAIDAMQKELDHIVKVEMPANSKEIGLAQEKGDLRENSEYKAALEHQIILQATITRLENQLKTVNLLAANQVNVDEIRIGTKVKLKDMKTDDIFVYSIMDQWDADVDKGIISYKSPLGNSLMKGKKGEKVAFGSGDSEQHFEILSIDKALDNEGRLI